MHSFKKPPEYFPALNLLRGETIDMRFFCIASLFKKTCKKGFKGFLKTRSPYNNDFKIIEKPIFGRHNNYPFFLRSLLKPIQASIMADLDTYSLYNFTEAEIAIMQASHCGEKQHTELVLSILNKIGLREENLLCPIIPPLSPDSLKEENSGIIRPITRVMNNCSGKHAMMLSVSKQLGYPIDSYNKPFHPVQKLILKKIGELTGILEPEKLPQTVDGCTVPVWALPFKSIAKAFFRLYNDEKYRILKDSYVKNPYIIGGKDTLGLRQDTRFMLLNPDLILKTGAGGFLSIYNNKKDEFLLIKMAQDNNIARNLIAARLLAALGWLNPEHLAEFDFNFYDEEKNVAGRYELAKTPVL